MPRIFSRARRATGQNLDAYQLMRRVASGLRTVGLGPVIDDPRLRRRLGVARFKARRAQAANARRRRLSSDHEVRLMDLPRTAPLWQRLAILEEGAHDHGNDIAWQRRLADTAIAMGRHDRAMAAAHRIVSLPHHSTRDWFRICHAQLAAHDLRAARRAHDRATSQARAMGDHRYALLGLGWYFQERSDWDLAADAYRDRFQRLSDEGQTGDRDLRALAYHAGLACDRCYLWAEAEHYYRIANEDDEADAFWRYKLGLALERQAKWREATTAYLAAAGMRRNRSAGYHRYRAAYCLHREGDVESACAAFFGATAIQHVRHKRFARLRDHHPGLHESAHWEAEAHDREEAGDTRGAARALERAIARSAKHPTLLWERYARLLYRAGEYQQAADAIVETRLFQTPDGIDLRPVSRRNQRSFAARYMEYRQTRPVDDRIVFFESFHGDNATCNPAAVFAYLATASEFSDYTFVWSIAQGKTVPDFLKNRDDVIVVERQSDGFLRYLATAGRLITNVSFPPFFTRRSGQQLLNTWHGTPLKTLGKDIKPGLLQHANVARNLLHATHVISPCPWTTEVLLDRYDVRHLFTGRLAELGSPRCDIGFHLSEGRRQEIRDRLHIGPGQTAVLYAPTWRGSQERPGTDLELTLSALDQLQRVPNVVPLFRGHHFADGPLADAGLAQVQVPSDIDTNELLAVIDVLITDYSSVFFDYLSFDRPIVFYVPDHEQYAHERGLYFAPQTYPGEVVTDIEGLAAGVVRALESDRSKLREEWRRRFAPHEDGNAVRRTVDFFFHDDRTHVVDHTAGGTGGGDRPRVLMRCAMSPNGITTSLLNLVSSIDPQSASLTVLVDTAVLARDEERQEQVSLLPDSVAQVGRNGQAAYTAEERWIVEGHRRTHRNFSDAHANLMSRAFRREFYRVFGPVEFDSIVEFDGYAPFWANFCAAGPVKRKRLIYQHNDLYREWQARFPELPAVFRTYNRYDRSIAVSPTLRDLNRENLAEPFGIDPERFAAARNQMNPRAALARAAAPLDEDIARWLESTSGHTFVSVGRLSIEKAHGLLLDCFADVCAETRADAGARLLIVGDGFLMDSLLARAEALGIGDRVLFTGQRSNPMSIMRHADTFVLTSSHEGQPMVLGEALLVGLDVIATDLPGVHDLLAERPGGQDDLGTLVPQSRPEIVAAMTEAVRAERHTQRFDAAEFVTAALDDFSRLSAIDLGMAEGFLDFEPPADGG